MHSAMSTQPRALCSKRASGLRLPLLKKLSAVFVLGMTTLGANAFAQAPKSVVRIGTGIDAAYAPWFLANRQKYFEQAGLDIQLKKFANGGEAIDGSIAGLIDLSGAAEPSVLVRMGRGDVRAIAVFGESATFVKMAVRPGITDVKQIKKIGVIPGSSGDYATVRLFEKAGVDPATITIVKSAPPELPALLSSGAIDAFFSWEPWPSLAVKQGAKILMNSGDVGYTFTMWVTAPGPWLEAHPKEAKAFVAGLAKACRDIKADPDKGAAAMQAETKAPIASTLALMAEVDCKVRDFTDADMKSYDQIADYLVKARITPTRVDFHKYMARGFYKE